ncbi:MAG: type VII toxin-antitoxin system MntA family adenylyltransferase antitoxin [Vicinamibacterales bacterium]
MTVDLDRQNGVIVEHLRRAFDDVVAVYRFGSTAQGTATSASDADIAILTRERIPPGRRFDVQEALAAAIGSDVDVIDLASASPVIAIQVIAGGSLLYDGDSDARGRFEDLTFGVYARLNEERRGILERIATEGTIYGR